MKAPGNSQEINRIWNTLGFGAKLYCKYCFLQNTSVSAIWVGVFSAYLVNVFTNMIGMTFLGVPHLIAYIANIVLSIVIFVCVIKLYSIHVASKERSDSESGTKSEHITLELQYFENNYSKIKRALYCLLICIVLLVVLIVMCSAINIQNSSVFPAPTGNEDSTAIGNN